MTDTRTASRTPVAVVRAQRRLGEDLSTWRKLRRLTAAEVADRAGVSADTVLRIEKGQSGTLENVLRIARALGVLEELAGSVDPLATDVGRFRAEEALPSRVRKAPGPQPR